MGFLKKLFLAPSSGLRPTQHTDPDDICARGGLWWVALAATAAGVAALAAFRAASGHTTAGSADFRESTSSSEAEVRRLLRRQRDAEIYALDCPCEVQHLSISELWESHEQIGGPGPWDLKMFPNTKRWCQSWAANFSASRAANSCDVPKNAFAGLPSKFPLGLCEQAAGEIVEKTGLRFKHSMVSTARLLPDPEILGTTMQKQLRDHCYGSIGDMVVDRNVLRRESEFLMSELDGMASAAATTRTQSLTDAAELVFRIRSTFLCLLRDLAIDLFKAAGKDEALCLPWGLPELTPSSISRNGRGGFEVPDSVFQRQVQLCAPMRCTWLQPETKTDIAFATLPHASNVFFVLMLFAKTVYQMLLKTLGKSGPAAKVHNADKAGTIDVQNKPAT